MEPQFIAQLLTVGGPVAALAILSILINYKLSMRWMDQVAEMMADYAEVTRALGEVTEALRRLNGKK